MKEYLVSVVLKKGYCNPSYRCRRKRFETKDEAYEFIKEFDKNHVDRANIYRLEESIEF